MSLSATFRLTADSRVILIGAGGHARSLLGVLHDIGCEVLGMVTDETAPGSELAGYTVLGSLAKLANHTNADKEISLVLAIGDNFHRLRIFHEILQQIPKANFPPIIHPSAVVAHDVVIGAGTVIMPSAVVNAGSELGAACILNTRSSLDHEGKMDDASALGPGVTTGGRVSIGARSFIGLGSSVVQGVSIGADTFVGAGALVLADLPGSVLAFGQPACVIRSRKADEPFL